MKGEQKFFHCKHCGNLVGLIFNAGVQMICCGEPMEELVANTAEAAHEKHLPVYVREGNEIKVSVGSAPHPMTEEHHIEWVYIQTTRGGQRKSLNIGEKPEMSFCVTDGDEPIAVFAYCNLHGLWKTDIQ